MSAPEPWAVAAVAIMDDEGTPLLLRTFCSPPSVLTSPQSPLQAHLYVGGDDIVKLHFLLFSSLDRCEQLWRASRQRARNETLAATAEAAAKNKRPPRPATLPNSAENPYDSVTIYPQESSSAGGRAAVSSASDVRYVGKLMESYRFTSYGFCSATGIKTLLVATGAEVPPDAMVPLCRAVYEAASSALCNPFRTPESCWRAQLELWSRSHAEAAHRAANNGDGNSPSCPALCLDGSFQEHSWPRCPPTLSTLAAGPTLALSKVFNKQLDEILTPFSVFSRSCIIS